MFKENLIKNFSFQHNKKNLINDYIYERFEKNKNIKKLLKIGHTGLLETLGEKISGLCFKDSRVLNAKINLQKMEVFKETKSVGIEILRKKDIQSKKAINSAKKKFNKI